MNIIKNEKGTFVELPRESITFCGNTEEEKKANELIFDLSLENDGLQQELKRYKNIIENIEKLVRNQLYGVFVPTGRTDGKVLQEIERKIEELKGE